MISMRLERSASTAWMTLDPLRAHFHVIEIHCYMKGFAREIVLKQTHTATRASLRPPEIFSVQLISIKVDCEQFFPSPREVTWASQCIYDVIQHRDINREGYIALHIALHGCKFVPRVFLLCPPCRWDKDPDCGWSRDHLRHKLFHRVESANRFCRSQQKGKKGDSWSSLH